MDQLNDVVAYRLGMLHNVALFEKKEQKMGAPTFCYKVRHEDFSSLKLK